MLGKIEGGRRRGSHRMRWLDGITDSMDMSLSKLPCPSQESLACCSPWGRKESEIAERLNWTELSLIFGMACVHLACHKMDTQRHLPWAGWGGKSNENDGNVVKCNSFVGEMHSAQFFSHLPLAADGICSAEPACKGQSELLLHSPLSPHCHKDRASCCGCRSTTPVCSVWRRERAVSLVHEDQRCWN